MVQPRKPEQLLNHRKLVLAECYAFILSWLEPDNSETEPPAEDFVEGITTGSDCEPCCLRDGA